MIIKKLIADLSRPFRKKLKKLRIEWMILPKMSKESARSTMRHEAHRIEKSYYNNVYLKGKEIYDSKAQLINKIFHMHLTKEDLKTNPDILWAVEISSLTSKLDKKFINKERRKERFEVDKNEFYKLIKERRSVRVWSNDQPSGELLHSLSKRLIKAGISMPCSGNRQAIKFLVLIENEDKSFLSGIKEKHCIGAPMVILVFANTSLYGSYETFGKGEDCILIDSAAAASAILIAAEIEGYSTCWNHFGQDLMRSRMKNLKAYKKLCQRFNIDGSLQPVAAIAIGKEEFNPPEPRRMELEDFII